MRYDVDPAKVLTAVGVVFAIAALVYFARDLVFDLSITVRALLLLLTFCALLVGALASSRSPLVLVESVLAAVAYLAFLAYTLSRFDVGADGTFLALLASAGLFMALGYTVQKRDVSPPTGTTRAIVVAIVLLAVVLVGADVAASEVTYDVQVAEEATVDDDGRTSVGTLTVDNRFVFREHVDEPQAFACIYLPNTEHEWRLHPIEYRLDAGRLPNSISGSTTITADMTLRLFEAERAAVDGPIPVERADSCPETGADRRIVVVLGDDLPRPPRPR
jgi:hypothetical protein